MSLNAQFEVGYTPDAAEEGSFVPLDMSTFTEYPTGGFGKYARLVYVVGNIQDDGLTSALTDRSGTITTGAAAQQVMAANAKRRLIIFQNVSDTDMWINIGATATAGAGSIKIIPGFYWTSPS